MDRITKEQALKLAKKYAEEHGYVLAEFAGQNSVFYAWGMPMILDLLVRWLDFPYI